jgi:hypothetical protein
MRNNIMRRNIYIIWVIIWLFSFKLAIGQDFTVVYDFEDDLMPQISGDAVTALPAVSGGTKLLTHGVVDDGGVMALKNTVLSNNATNYNNTFVRFDIFPAQGLSIRVTEIKVTQRSSMAGVPGQSQTYLYRIGCALNDVSPAGSDPNQSTANLLFADFYSASSFNPGSEYATAAVDDFVSAFVTARGRTTSNDDFDWYIDKVEITGMAFRILDLPDFSVVYDFEGGSRQAAINADAKLSASNMSSRSAEEGISAGGRYWIGINNNTNSIGFSNMGLHLDVTPFEGYELVMNNMELIHAGSGEMGASRVNRIGIYTGASREGSGVEIGREDFTSYTGRNIYGDQVPASSFNVTRMLDASVYTQTVFFTFSVNRTGNPPLPEYWTVDRVVLNGWYIPVGRGELLKHIALGQNLLFNARVGEALGEYQQSIFDAFRELLLDATDALNDLTLSQSYIDQLTTEVETAVNEFPGLANTGSIAIMVNTASTTTLSDGFAGFNTRIADSPWNYTHPDFIEATKKMSPAFLRYFSGTTGDYFDMNTGYYELQWFEGVINSTDVDDTPDGTAPFTGIPNLYKWIDGRMPHSVNDLNEMLGELGAKMVVTWNGFYDSPDRAANFARFCKNNHIIVDNWQFCNEPNFFTPPRRYFWNNGDDYTHKMREIADSIKSVFPHASMSMSYGWGWSGFGQQIKNYQNNNPRYWDVVSVHAYPTHIRSDVTIYDGMLTANRSLDTHTGNAYFSDMTSASWPNSPLLITEVGVWNDGLRGTIYASLYIAEYYMRLSQQPRSWMIGKHHIASAVQPVVNHQNAIFNAYDAQLPINTDTMETGYSISREGHSHALVNKAFKNSSHVYTTANNSTVVVPKRGGGNTAAIYTTAYKGINDRDFLLVSNKSEFGYEVDLTINGEPLTGTLFVEYLWSPDPGETNFAPMQDTISAENLYIHPYSITRIEWLKDASDIPAPMPTRIYGVDYGSSSVDLRWWNREIADSYTVRYGTAPGVYPHTFDVNENRATLEGLAPDTDYYAVVTASNANGMSGLSNEVSIRLQQPDQPVVNYIHEDDARVTIHWESVPFANGYRVRLGTSPGIYTEDIDAGNVSGYVIRRLNNGTSYHVSVVAYNGSGESESSPEVVVTPVANRPWPPVLVNATENGDGSVTIGWTPSSISDGARYDIFYCPTPWDEPNYIQVASNVEGTAYTDMTPRPKGAHYYRVKAVNHVRESHFYSQIATVNKNIEVPVNVINPSKGNLRVFPNPSSGEVFIASDGSERDFIFRVFSLCGKLLLSGEGNRVDMSGIVPGLYLLEVTRSGEVSFMKVVRK